MTIPEDMQEKYNEIAPLITTFCNEKLNDEYNDICIRLLTKLCRKRSAPLLSGRPKTWAAGIVYAIGSNNFIFDKTQKLHLTANEIASPFGISASTAGNKANEIKKMFKIDFFNTEWQTAELRENNPIVWMIKINGFIVDARSMSLDVQQQAFEMGLIPYVPGVKTDKDDLPNEASSEIKDSEQTIVENEQRQKKKMKEENKDQLNFLDLLS